MLRCQGKKVKLEREIEKDKSELIISLYYLKKSQKYREEKLVDEVGWGKRF